MKYPYFDLFNLLKGGDHRREVVEQAMNWGGVRSSIRMGISAGEDGGRENEWELQ